MKKKGYTLIEMLIVLAIVSLLFNAIFDVLNMGNNSFNSGSTQQTVENQARQGLGKMAKELHKTNAGRIAFSDANTTITFKLPIRYDYIDDKGQIIWGAEGVEDYKISYTVANKQVVRKVLNASDTLISQKVLAVDIQSLEFSLDVNLLTITLTAQKNAIGGKCLTQSLSSKVTFRN